MGNKRLALKRRHISFEFLSGCFHFPPQTNNFQDTFFPKLTKMKVNTACQGKGQGEASVSCDFYSPTPIMFRSI